MKEIGLGFGVLINFDYFFNQLIVSMTLTIIQNFQNGKFIKTPLCNQEDQYMLPTKKILALN